MTTDEKQAKIQKKYVEYQVAEQQIKQYQEQLEKLESQSLEVEAVMQSITDISNSEKGKEVLVPVSGGIFFRAEMKDSANFLVNVGAGVVVQKDSKGAQELIRRQGEEIEKVKDHLMAQLAQKIEEYQQLETDLKALIQD